MNSYNEFLDKLEKLDSKIAGIDFTPKKDELREKIARVQRLYRGMWILFCVIMVEFMLVIWVLSRKYDAYPDWFCAVVTIVTYAVITYPWKVVYK